MKLAISGLAMLISSAAFANPFDGFVGSYKVTGTPSVRRVNAKFCGRFDFQIMTGFEIMADTHGYKQSHMLRFVKPYGWTGQPVMDYREASEINSSVGSYAKTSGSSDTATTEQGSFGMSSGDDKLRITVSKNGAAFSLSMTEELIVKGAVVAGCYYQANLVK